jgi:tRNA-2-methylthio-N6-dimethylallyladenosine synthase
VGFPGETEDDFQDTLRVMEAARFATAYTFQYSPRPGTAAADLPGHLPKDVVQDRYVRLAALQERISAEENARQVGRTVEVLVGEANGRKDGATQRLTGRAADNTLVHLAEPVGVQARLEARRSGADGDPRSARDLEADVARPGDLVTVTVTRSAPHYVVADSAVEGGVFQVRRTRAGDAWAARERAGAGDEDGHAHGSHGGNAAASSPGAGGPAPVLLGMPSARR